MDLHPLERKVLEGLKKIGKEASAEKVAEKAGIEKIQAERFGYSLSQKGLVELKKKEEQAVKLTELGNKNLEEGLPEEKVLGILKKKAGEALLPEIAKETDLNQNEIGASLGILKRNAFISTENTKNGLKLKLTGLGKKKAGTKSDLSSALKKIKKGKKIDQKLLNILEKRGMAEVSESAEYFLKAKGNLKKALKKGKGKAHQLTHKMLKTGSWKDTEFRTYDLKAEVEPFYGGKLHPITVARNRIRKIFLELGFEEREGPIVESSFWNFDALFQPQDHPARDLADTFYLENPKTTKLPDKKIVSNVKEAHGHGIEDSKGWQYDWSEEKARRAVLRTHTTAVSCRALNDVEPPAKVFSIGRTFRNETVDYKHLPEFTQIDGIVADENVTFKDLLGYLKEFFFRLGFEKIRFRPAYFPYTEMSVEPEVYLEEKDEWIELGGSGIFRPEVTEPLGINVPVLAWGLSLERPIMLKLGLNDIRHFYYKNDLKWLREAPIL